MSGSFVCTCRGAVLQDQRTHSREGQKWSRSRAGRQRAQTRPPARVSPRSAGSQSARASAHTVRGRVPGGQGGTSLAGMAGHVPALGSSVTNRACAQTTKWATASAPEVRGDRGTPRGGHAEDSAWNTHSCSILWPPVGGVPLMRVPSPQPT